MEKQVFAKVYARLIPYMILLYIMNYLDRVNISYAQLKMKGDLGFDDAIYAAGVSAFFIGYCIFEVPSNLIMEKVGARVWMARIMITWGAVSTCMMFVQGQTSFYALRFLLGVAEAGFFPGMVLYLTYWLPQRMRAHAGALFLTSTALSGVIGGPVAGVILEMDGVGGMHGWQWLFLLEGIPTVLLGFVTLFYLTDRPEHAKWLTDEERKWLIEHLAKEDHHTGHSLRELSSAFVNWRVWLLCAIYSMILAGYYCMHYWVPSIIKSLNQEAGTATVGVLAVVPFLAGAAGMVVMGRLSDRSGQHPMFVCYTCLIGAGGLLAAAFAGQSTPLLLVFLAVAAVGIFGTLGPFWAMPPSFLSGAAAAGGIALVNSVGNFFGGFLGPPAMAGLKEGNTATGVINTGCDYLSGVIGTAAAENVKAATHTFTPGLIMFAVILVIGASLALMMRGHYRAQPASVAVIPQDATVHS